MKAYVVGGSVRDELLGRPHGDRDWVVVGATPEDMIAAGFRPVGKDFPVFLHPTTHEEYALARTERKTAPGYHGFVFHAAPDVTLEQDLARRDLTINAMARDENGALVDPFGGKRDWVSKAIVHLQGMPLTPEGLAKIGVRHSEGGSGGRIEIHFHPHPGGLPLVAQIDGEEFPATSRVSIEVLPRAIRLVVPREYVEGE